MKMKNLFIVAALAVALLLFACSPAQEAEVADTVEDAMDDYSDDMMDDTIDDSSESMVDDDMVGDEAPAMVEGDVTILGPAGFDPAQFTASVGESVTFVNGNADDIDVVNDVVLVFKKVGKVGAQNSPKLMVGEAYTHTFEEAGTWEFWTVGYGVKGTAIVE